MFGDLFIKAPTAGDLSDVCKSLAAHLGIQEFLERESSNYIGGGYYAGSTLGVIIHLSLTDDLSIGRFPFHLTFRPDGFIVERSGGFDWLADIVARKLAMAGYEVIRSPDYELTSATFFKYTYNSGTKGDEYRGVHINPFTIDSR